MQRPYQVTVVSPLISPVAPSNFLGFQMGPELLTLIKNSLGNKTPIIIGEGEGNQNFARQIFERLLP